MTRPSATLIGTFVLGAAALVVAGGAVLRRRLAARTALHRGELFRRLGAGLARGRAGDVPRRAGRRGEVDGRAREPPTGQSIIQVNMELVPGMVTLYGAPRPDSETLVASLVNEGLTAQLVKQSFVTGLLSVELAFRPGAEVSRLGDTSLPEVPTVPGDLEGLAKQLQTVDIAAVLESLQRTLASAEAVLSNPGLGQAVGQLPQGHALAQAHARHDRARGRRELGGPPGNARLGARARDDARSRQRSRRWRRSAKPSTGPTQRSRPRTRSSIRAATTRSRCSARSTTSPRRPRACATWRSAWTAIRPFWCAGDRP